MPMIYWKMCNSELDKYVVDKERQHDDDLIFCVALFFFRFVLCVISNITWKLIGFDRSLSTLFIKSTTVTKYKQYKPRYQI